MIKLNFLLIALLISVTGFAQDLSISNVFGSDDRVAMTSTKYPWRSIGRVTIGSTYCTGTLVWKNIVLTTAPCVIDPTTKKLTTDPIDFLAGFNNGKTTGKSEVTHVWWGTNDPDNFRAYDWALLLLKKPIGKRLGYLGWNPLDLNKNSGKVTMVGYSEDYKKGLTAGVHIGCQVKKESNQFWLHDCDTSRGSSGGPMFQIVNGNEYRIVALNAAELRNGGSVSLRLPVYSDQYANIAVKTSSFSQKLKELRKKYP